jgi:hypothetical protein
MKLRMIIPRRFIAPNLLRLAILLAIGLTGCASVKPTQTGYLSDYSHIEKKPTLVNWGLGYHKVLIREPTPAELTGIDSFFIEPIGWLCPENDWLANDPTRRERVTATLDRNLRDRFGKIRPIVSTPGPNTARVHAAVTDVASARNITNILASIVFGPISNGGAAIEAEVLRLDGSQIAAVTGASHGGGLDMIGYYVRSGHAKKSVRRLAGDLSSGVAEAAEIPVCLPKCP